MQKIEQSPTLNTVLMVEEVLKNAGEVIKVAELKRKLPKKVMHQTLLTILDHLQVSGKIIISTKGVLLRIHIGNIRATGRNTMGVHLMRLDAGDIVSDVARIIVDENEDKS